MKIAILGYGKQGKAAYEYWSATGDEITVCDQDETITLPKNVRTRLGKTYLENLSDFDIIVRSPSIHPKDIVAKNSIDILDKVTTVTNEFLRVCPTKNIIGVTGTKGKGTTSTLIARILESTGQTVHLGGNIGIPPLELLKNDIQKTDWVVLELANFQLIDLKQSPHIAACLLVVPEHLNWHSNFEEYAWAKSQLFIHQSPQDIAIYYAGNTTSKQVASAGAGKLIPYYESPGAHIENDTFIIDGVEICNTHELQLLGKHNWQNVCAAITVAWQITQNVAKIRNAVINFSGLPHRLEFIRKIDGVDYYNDSFASTPDASIAAIEAIPKNKVMIIGGFDRHLPLKHLAKAIKTNESNLRLVMLIGESSERLAQELEEEHYSNFKRLPKPSMNEIVSTAKEYAQKGDAIVLSPGFASFDMFKNFEDRGEQFKSAVQNL